MNIHPLVTIAIPTYNRADTYLPQVLHSAINQTYSPLEIIVSDNCSTDNTEEVVGKFLVDPRLRYIKHKENIGALENSNFCLKEAKGDYFLLLHDDDVIDKDHIEACLKAANYRTTIGLIRTGIRWIDQDGKVLYTRENPGSGLSTDDFFISWFKGKVPMHLCGTLFNKKGLQEIGGFNGEFGAWNDVSAEVEMAARFSRVDVNDIKGSFRRHSSSHSSSFDITQWCETSGKLLNLMCDLVPGKEVSVRKEGRVFFADHNYKLAKKISTFMDRMWAYSTVYRAFGYPVKLFFLRLKILYPFRRVLRKVMKILSTIDNKKNPIL